jgi:hypothetical protein
MDTVVGLVAYIEKTTNMKAAEYLAHAWMAK